MKNCPNCTKPMQRGCFATTDTIRRNRCLSCGYEEMDFSGDLELNTIKKPLDIDRESFDSALGKSRADWLIEFQIWMVYHNAAIMGNRDNVLDEDDIRKLVEQFENREKTEDVKNQ